MMKKQNSKSLLWPPIRSLGMIGDRRTAALLTTEGHVVWYCPERFDAPSLFGSLLDPEQGGVWEFLSEGMAFHRRTYIDQSAVLQTVFSDGQQELTLTDFMPVRHPLRGICRRLSRTPKPVSFRIHPAPAYAHEEAQLQVQDQCVLISQRHSIYSSHAMEVAEESVWIHVGAGEEAWVLLTEEHYPDLQELFIEEAQQATLQFWAQLADNNNYQGPYEDLFHHSLRALRMLTFEETGAIIAAATTSLPEVVGGERNYDYRYVWLRDTAMIVSALTRAGGKGEEGRNFLSFLCDTLNRHDDALALPFYTIDKDLAPGEQTLQLRGYHDSRPVRTGNGANSQLQLDANGNVLLAAKLIYGRFDTREHWETVRRLADFLCENWMEPDYGIWEEGDRQHYTANKVVVACALEYISEYADDNAQAERWKKAAQQIRQFVQQHCLTSSGAYAVVAGEEGVDVSAALFPVWAYVDPGAPEVLATIAALEKNYQENNLFWRHLRCFDSRKEGAFLAGTVWVAQYYIMQKNYTRFHQIMQAVGRYVNDLGFVAEEASPEGHMLGNFPQTFVHASLIGAIYDYKTAMEKEENAKA